MKEKIKSLCVFGSSVTWGTGDKKRGGWANRLQDYLSNQSKRGYTKLYNLGISNDTTSDILKRFQREALARRANGLIFFAGNNDASYKYKTGVFRIPLSQFEKNLEEIIKRGKKITRNIIFICTRNFDETKTIPVSWADDCFTNKNMKRYNQKIKEVCKRNKVLFLDTGELKKDEFYDGLHPNKKGHEKIFQKVAKFLKKNKWI